MKTLIGGSNITGLVLADTHFNLLRIGVLSFDAINNH